MSLKNKIAIITGAGSGIGRELCLRFVSEGIDVAAVGRTFEKLDKLGLELKNSGSGYLPLAYNVADPDAVRSMIETVKSNLGIPDILINSAGIHSGADILNSEDHLVKDVIDSSFFGTIYCTREAYRLMKNKGAGHVINIASQGAGWPGRWEAVYGSAKAAQVMFSLKTISEFASANEELRANGFADSFFCHVLCPGPVDTPMQAKAKDRSAMLGPAAIAEAIILLLQNPGQGLDFLMEKSGVMDFKVGSIGVFEKHQNIIRIFK